ncbi:hypothetical protein M514_08459 [Trichuris suis]|uniref:Uncharacterized protein n=1 Tax=Trichuris suis TaxID=68888 RepID=A0A085M0A6_9BILA|nr:hypothetical protein M513_08459 [Trichuris suis]KFD61559.1 hypothetical protein M514_08459 [Trichuris suis]
MMGSRVRDDRSSTGTTKASPVFRHVPPKTHCCGYLLPLLYLLRENRDSSNSTVFDDPPSCTGASPSASATTGRRCLFQRAVTLLFIPEMEVLHTAPTQERADQYRARLDKISSSCTFDSKKIYTKTSINRTALAKG